MEDNKVLVLDNVSVRYRIRDSRSTADIFRRLLKKMPRNNEFWALKNISFSLDKGDMLGVIGKNGAGKSTMMKAISGTLLPASGTIEKEGKLCALLELGAGFDQEMTVKENVYLRGALLGYSKEFIDSKYDEIIDFADMREFQDNAFRTLSSGMKSRIAFSIASMVEPDMIILDEIFAVGDGDFRKKSQKCMQDIIARGDTTALMVSHSLQTVRDQCNKVLWLDRGRMVMFGEPKTVCDAYAEYLSSGKLPETESLKATEKNPTNKMAITKGKLFGNILVYLLLLMFTLGGVFFWSQYDLFKGYSMGKSMQAEDILAEADAQHDEVYDVLGVDTSEWDYNVFSEYADKALDEDLTIREVSKEVLSELGIESGDSSAYEAAAAKLETINHIYRERVERLMDEIKASYDKLPENDRPSLLRYTYSECKRFYKLEGDYEDELQTVIEQVRDDFIADGIPEANADKLYNLFKAEKSYMIAYYIDSLI